MTKGTAAANEAKIASSTNGVGRAGQLHAKKNETWSPTYTIHKYKFKVDENLNISHDTIKVLEENIDRNISDIPCGNIFTDISPRARDIKEKNKQMGVQNKKLLHG